MSDHERRMQSVVRHLAEQLARIRPGTLSAGFLATFRVGVAGNLVPLQKVGVITAQGDRLVIRPFDPANLSAIVKALADAKLSAYALDPLTVAVSVPPASAQQRAEIARHVKRLGDEAKVAVRMVRQDARKQIAARGRGSQRAVQESTDRAVEEIDRLVAAKLAELGR